MSEFDPRWSAGRQETPGQGQQGEPDRSGSQPSAPQPNAPQPNAPQPNAPQQGYPGFYGQPGHQDYRSGQGIGDPSTGPGYTYPGTYAGGQPGEVGHTSQFGQPGWQQQQGGQWTQQYPQYQPYQPPRRRTGRTVGFVAGAVALSVLIGLGIGRIAWPSDSANTATQGNQNFGSSSGSSGGGTSSTSINPQAIAAKVDPGLVDINTVLGYQSAEAAGTGIVLTANGEILTNNHVVEGATSIKVTDIGNGQTYTASVVGFSRTQDIAIIQLQNASGLKTETLGDSTKVAVGDAVVGIGNAGGAGGTPSAAAGKVTALNQSITASDDSSNASEKLTGLIQTDANIQSGDSGGSLVNSAGQVIGVDTAASSGYQFSGGFGQGTQGDQGTGHQGFAIPINQAITIAHQIIAGTASNTVHIGKTAFLGVTVSNAGQSQDPNAQGQDPNAGGSGSGATSGASIVQTLPSGPAEAAGLQEGDTITSLNGTAIDSATTLTNLMDRFHPGDKLSVVYSDANGQQHTVTVTPAEGPVG
jgi:S1-C subfamily serine protease